MTPEDFQHLQTLMATRAGYLLTRERIHLARHRLGPVARREGFASVDALVAQLRAAPPGELAWAVIEALLNAETWFRRDRTPFSVFAREVAPAIGRVRPSGAVRVWSAGCGSGQEAYSLGIVAAKTQAKVEIVATDLSPRALEKAQSGYYTPFEVQRGLSAAQMLNWFEQGDEMWRVRPELRQSIAFRHANLLDTPTPTTDAQRFDVIFCRYVLCDMEPTRRARALDILADSLVDDGCLFLGLGEAIDERTFRAVPGRDGLFVKSPTALRRAA
jgi:chemotaxis protein methyltransferase CheR